MAAQLIVPSQLHVYGKAEPGKAVDVLRESAGRAAMLVLGRDKVSWFERLLLGAVTSQVVGQVACPVVVVPARWRARYASPRLPVIVALMARRRRSLSWSWRSRRRGCMTLALLCCTLSRWARRLAI
jgi:hypothetical protein